MWYNNTWSQFAKRKQKHIVALKWEKQPFIDLMILQYIIVPIPLLVKKSFSATIVTFIQYYFYEIFILSKNSKIMTIHNVLRTFCMANICVSHENMMKHGLKDHFCNTYVESEGNISAHPVAR